MSDHTALLCQVQFKKSRTSLQSWVEFSWFDVVIEKFFPVFVDWGLTIAYKSHTFLHQRADIEAVGKTSVYSGQPTPAHLPHRNDRFVDNLRDICFEHQQL